MEPALSGMERLMLAELQKGHATFPFNGLHSGWLVRQFLDPDEPCLARWPGCDKVGWWKPLVESDRHDPDRVPVKAEQLAGPVLNETAATAGHPNTPRVASGDRTLSDRQSMS
jgi:hypothetical protein